MSVKIPSDFSVEERSERAASLFMEGYNCCQSVVLAFSDLLPCDENTLRIMASGFGGGMARLREVCGAMSGMAMIAGFISPADNPSDMEARTRNYALVQQFAASYKEKMGSIICRDILGLRAAGHAVEPPRPSERTAEYYKSRPCALSCSTAAAIVAEYLMNNACQE